MKLEDRIALLDKLGGSINLNSNEINECITKANSTNQWFTGEEIRFSLAQAKKTLFNKTHLNNWLSKYSFNNISPKVVGLVLAGNIPMVGLHDVICVFLAGHRALVKLSDKDNVLIPFLLDKMKSLDAECENYFEITARLNLVDAIIATGSDTSSMYFEKYFGKYPNIIRKHRNSVAILTGNETEDELLALGEDVFRYFGLGCRNVSMIYAPVGYDWKSLLRLWEKFNNRMEHHKYKNNFDFNYALYLMNNKNFLHNGSIILCDDDRLSSRIGTIHTAYYKSQEDLKTILEKNIDTIQCIVGQAPFNDFKHIPFGMAQCPHAGEYADNIDTIEFLLELK